MIGHRHVVTRGMSAGLSACCLILIVLGLLLSTSGTVAGRTATVPLPAFSESIASGPVVTLLVRLRAEWADTGCTLSGSGELAALYRAHDIRQARRPLLRADEPPQVFRARAAQLGTRFPLREARGAAVAERAPPSQLPHYCALTVPTDRLADLVPVLRDHPAVEVVQANRLYVPTPAVSVGSSPAVPAAASPGGDVSSSSALPIKNAEVPWGVARIGAPAAWKTTQGAGVVVAVIDSGVDLAHPDLADRFWTNAGEASGAAGVDDDGNGVIDDLHGVNLVANPIQEDAPPSGDPTDVIGHGSHVAGTIAARLDGWGVVGVAPQARIMAIKAGNGGFTSIAILQAVEYAVENGAEVMNLSLGGLTVGDGDPLFADAMAYAAVHGVIAVAAAGNEGIDVDNADPARFPPVIAVGATTSDELPAPFSNFGHAVSVVAPGDAIYSLDAATHGHLVLSGTSMAAPHVTGAVALLLAAHPGATSAQIRQSLRMTSQGDIGAPGWDWQTSFGRLRVDHAIDFVPLACTAQFVTADRSILTMADAIHVDIALAPPAQGTPTVMVDRGSGAYPVQWTPFYQGPLNTPMTLSFSQVALVPGPNAFRVRAEHTNGVPCAADLLVVTRVDQTPALALRGPATHPAFGRAVAPVYQDLNGDGALDLVVGSPVGAKSPTLYLSNPTASAVGQVQIFSLPWGQLGGAAPLDMTDPSVTKFTLVGEFPHDGVGSALAADGDIDGDGIHDLLIGAPTAPCAGKTDAPCGAVYLVLGKTIPKGGGWLRAPTTSAYLAKWATLIWRGTDQVDDLWFGRGVRWLGDVDGDGRDDAALMTDRRALLLHSGAVVSSLQTPQIVPLDDAIKNKQCESVLDAVEFFPAGDLNGDGRRDVLALRPLTTSGLPGGTVAPPPSWYLLHWAKVSGLEVMLPYTLQAPPEFHIDGGPLRVSATGRCNLDGDGPPELLIASSGLSQVMQLRNMVSAKAIAVDPPPLPLASLGQVTGQQQIVCLGDVNGDGRDDLGIQWQRYQSDQLAALGAVLTGRAALDYAPGLLSYAAARVLAPLAGRPTTTHSLLHTLPFQSEQIAVGDYTLNAAGDLNQDGYADLVFGIPNEVNGPQQSKIGGLYVYFGGPQY